MLARSITINHANGATCPTPLLVPSFSSKGFGYYRAEADTVGRKKRASARQSQQDKPKLLSEAAAHLNAAGPLIDESLLISAYDIHFGLLDRPHRYLKGKSLTFIDSGGYELAAEYDSAEPKNFEYRPRSGFGINQYCTVLDGLSAEASCVIANFDTSVKFKPITEQVDIAGRLFRKYPHFTSNFLLKPGCKADGSVLKYIEVNRHIRPELDSMRHFGIIGVTEKELGSTLLKKLETLASLRLAMDEAGMDAKPIHLWGGLDPVLTPLYFFAGANIFDGVSWLRYAFHEGTAVSWDAGPILQGRLGNSELADALTVANNIAGIQALEIGLRRFVQEGANDFTMFNHHAKALEAAFRVMETTIPAIRRVMKERV